jgi:hypothetical protein
MCVDNMKSVRHEASKTFRIEKTEYLKHKINKFETEQKYEQNRYIKVANKSFENVARFK